jgi:polysaccharide chain length determinant protein (PEP-CTERM system associated)
MNSLKSQAMQLLQMLWRQKWISVATVWAVCTVGWIAVALIPTKYESSARVYLDADPVLTPLLHGLAADTNPARHLDFLQRTLLSRPNIEELVRLTDLDIGINSSEAKEALYQQLAAEVQIRAIAPNLMIISYSNKDPLVAKNVVQSLLTIFSEKTAGSSRSEMDSAQRFLDDEIASYRDQLHAKDQQRAMLAQKYPDIVSSVGPEDAGAGGASESRLDQARAAAQRARDELADALTKRNSLRKEIASVPPMLSVNQAPQVVVTGGRLLSPDEQRLAQMKANLDSLRLKYTDKHPDVIAQRQEIRQFEAEMKRAATTGGSSGSDNVKTQIPNAIYDQLKVKLADAEGQVATTQRQVAETQAEVDRIERIARSVPEVLIQVEDLDRDYGILRRNYEELVSRRQATQIADAADTKTEKIQFRIIDPPQVPLVPIEPNRPMLISLAMLAGLGAGIAAPIVVGQFDRSFTAISQLRELGIPVLGSITRISLGGSRRRAAMQLAGLCAAGFMLVAVYGTLLLFSLNLHSVGIS